MATHETNHAREPLYILIAHNYILIVYKLHIINIGKWMATHETNHAREPVKAFYDAHKLAQFIRTVEEQEFLFFLYTLKASI
jgi:hypothetical protein